MEAYHVGPTGSASDSILASAARGDPEAWRTLLDHYAPRVFALLVHQCGDRDLADEITQDTFVRVVIHLDRYHEQGKFEPWLFRIAMNRLRDEMRRRNRQARPLDMTSSRASQCGPKLRGESWDAVQYKIVEEQGQLDPFVAASDAEQIELLRRTICRLNKADQEILSLRHTAELSFVQIAQTLNEPLGTVLARSHRAMGKLRKLLGVEPAIKTTGTVRPRRKAS